MYKFNRYGGPQLSHPNQMLTANSNHSQQFQITHNIFKSLTANYNLFTANYKSVLTANYKMIDHTRRLQSPPVSGARRQIIFVIHEAATCEVSAPVPLMETLFLSQINLFTIQKIVRRWTEQNLFSFTFRG